LVDKNYVNPYNIDFKYRLEFKESNTDYNLTPVSYDKAVAMAKLVKFLWIDSYIEVMNDSRDFVCSYCPKMIFLVGSPAYDQGQITLGTAEGGIKVTLYNVNSLNLANINIEDLNFWYFKTMHHEFAHILHQTVEFPKDFYDISSGKYFGSGWLNITNEKALQSGFITPYGGSEVHEDFAEILSSFITNNKEWWDAKMSIANNGASTINLKLEIIRTYMKNVWNVDIDKLRDIIQRRSSQINYLDLTSLE
jgi:hypothetical protein